MLALSRKKNEAIVINNDIEITVLEVKGDQVKIGITAPKEVPIYRKEVYLQIQEANKAAVDAGSLSRDGLMVAMMSSISTRWILDSVPIPIWLHWSMRPISVA